MGPGACSQRSPGRLLGGGPGSGPQGPVQHPPHSPFTGGQTRPTEQENHAHRGRDQSWECDSKGRALCQLPCHLLAWEGGGERGRPGPSVPTPVFRRHIALSLSWHSKHASGTPDTPRALNYLPQRKHVRRGIPTGGPAAEPTRREAAFPPGRSSLPRTPPCQAHSSRSRRALKSKSPLNQRTSYWAGGFKAPATAALKPPTPHTRCPGRVVLREEERETQALGVT